MQDTTQNPIIVTDAATLRAIVAEEVSKIVAQLPTSAAPGRALNVEELMTKLGIGKSSAYALMHSEGFPSQRVGKRLLVAEAAVDAWLEKRAANIPFQVAQ